MQKKLVTLMLVVSMSGEVANLHSFAVDNAYVASQETSINEKADANVNDLLRQLDEANKQNQRLQQNLEKRESTSFWSRVKNRVCVTMSDFLGNATTWFTAFLMALGISVAGTALFAVGKCYSEETKCESVWDEINFSNFVKVLASVGGVVYHAVVEATKSTARVEVTNSNVLG